MNLHPIFVHFPIALLTVYCLLELARFKKVMSQPYWFYAKALVVMIGGLGALAAYYLGSMAKQAVRDGTFTPAVSNYRQVLSMHETFAQFSLAIFGIIAAGYLILWLQHEDFTRFLRGNSSSMKFWQLLVKIAHALVETKFVIVLAIIGLICISITGGLGGIMVYGTNADPFFGSVYHLMFPGM